MNKQIIDIEQVLENWERNLINIFPKIIDGIAVFLLFFILAHLAKFISKRLIKNAQISRLSSTIIYVFFLFSGIFLALELAGLQTIISHFLAGAGIASIIAGFAFKDVASNFFSGLLLKIHIPYKKGDWIEINEQYGEVQDVGWLTTSIKNISGQQVSIPNQIIYTGTFTNYSTWGKRRIIIQSGVSYGDDLDKVKAVAIDEIRQIDNILHDEKIDFYFTEIGDSSFNFVLRFWTQFHTHDDFHNAQSEAITRIKKRFEKENISIPFNVMSLDFGVKGGINLFDNKININKE